MSEVGGMSEVAEWRKLRDVGWAEVRARRLPPCTRGEGGLALKIKIDTAMTSQRGLTHCEPRPLPHSSHTSNLGRNHDDRPRATAFCARNARRIANPTQLEAAGGDAVGADAGPVLPAGVRDSALCLVTLLASSSVAGRPSWHHAHGSGRSRRSPERGLDWHRSGREADHGGGQMGSRPMRWACAAT